MSTKVGCLLGHIAIYENNRFVAILTAVFAKDYDCQEKEFNNILDALDYLKSQCPKTGYIRDVYITDYRDEGIYNTRNVNWELQENMSNTRGDIG